ncbi:hypothetical protein [Vagococcus silagei]|uniref:DUF4179 domain-containing protein n=1 Tax=Vagococcus silagei TaxID=2508885 RepID=A0A4S3B8A3_9ENTE|nr:hypothetical protein [Vagococcus silagei]THB62360.1 hypothetical protein ESZ54_00675 [Vagococcus silagei]
MSKTSKQDYKQWLEEEIAPKADTKKKIDQTYENIMNLSAKKAKQKRKRRTWISLGVVAAIMTLGIYNFEQVQAVLEKVITFSNPWSQSLGDATVKNNKKSENNEVVVAIDSYFSTPESFGFDYSVSYEDQTKFKSDSSIWLNYAIKNGDGTYLFDNAQDPEKFEGSWSEKLTDVEGTQQLNQDKTSLSGSEYHFLTDNLTKLPLLENAKVEIKSIVIDNKSDNPQVVEGEWVIPLNNQTKRVDYTPVDYQLTKESSIITLENAVSNVSHFNFSFRFKQPLDVSDMELLKVTLIDEEGVEYKASMYNLEENNQLAIYQFPFIKNNNGQRLRAVIKSNNKKLTEFELEPKK